MLKLNTITFLIASSILAVSHAIALQLFLYWRYDWLDMAMHTLGGAVIVLGVYAARELSLPLAKAISQNLALLFAAAFFIMIGWEAFEFYNGVTFTNEFVSDTISDLCFGTLGVLLGLGAARSITRLN